MERADLKTAARALTDELNLRRLQSPFRRRLKIEIYSTSTGGWSAQVGTFKGLSVEVWLDSYLRRSDRFFWFGFTAGSNERVQTLVDGLPKRLRPAMWLGENDIEDVKGLSRLRQTLSDAQLRLPVQETYKNWGEFFFGKYDSAEAPSRHGSRLDTSRAASFIAEVVLAGRAPREFEEGACQQVTSSRFERDRRARKECLIRHGYKCLICAFDFEKVYGGKLGHHFIHVHHLKPLSGGDGHGHHMTIDDLIPVCPNCHAMLHREVPPLSPARLVRALKKGQSIFGNLRAKVENL